MEHHKTEAELKREIIEDHDRYASKVRELEQRLSGQGGPIPDHETRLRALESWRWWMTGIGVCVSLLVTVSTAVCTWVVTTSMEQVIQRLPPSVERRR